ncbi:MAG: amidohydrolase family protein [Firmicutes bacterium]|jgi:N-acyl-D-amino-acid deacylase|nr:amidohydrolase family protein [Bacillota bacterium]
MKDLKILNGKIPNFESNTWEIGDILIDKGVIQKVGTVYDDTAETIDAQQKIVSPGFIDIHAHENQFTGGENDFFTASCEARMGVTTKVGGNCGDSYNPLEDFCEKVNSVGSPTNYMMFVGQNSLRQYAGADDRYKPSTPKQLDQMKRDLANAKKYGPVGLSCGFEYAPGVTTDETVELLTALDEEGYLTSVHFRSDGPDSLKSIEELIEIQRRSGYGMEMSHIGSCSAVGYMEQALECISNARDQGVDITCDCYPYTAFCTGIGTAVFDEESFQKWDYSDLLVTSGPYKGKRCDKALFETLRRADPDLYVAAFVMNEPEVELAFQAPFVMVGSDCGFSDGGGHPRGAGTFPRVLGRLVREKGVLTLMDALRKMTVLPADRLNLRTKGEIKEGFDADIVIFDEATIVDCATYENPTLPPEGISHVILNGQIAVKGKTLVNGTLGRFIPYKNK